MELGTFFHGVVLRAGGEGMLSWRFIQLQWLCGSVALWACGSVPLWLCASVLLWLCDSVAKPSLLEQVLIFLGFAWPGSASPLWSQSLWLNITE